MKLRPMDEATFLRLSEGIPDYAGPDLDRIQARMRDFWTRVEAGTVRLVPDAEIDAEIVRRAAGA